jgi:hypothetical protein
MVKMRVMTYLWRLQQSQLIVSMILWAVLLTLTSYQYVGWRLQQFFFNSIYLGFLILFLIIFGFIILVGFAFDAIFKLWKEQSIVIAHRNPYLKERLYPKEVVMWRHMFLPILKRFEDTNPEVKEEIAFMERWINRCMDADSETKKEVDEVEAWILSKGSA